MKLTYAELTSPGPRANNEDSIGFWEDCELDEALTRGAMAVLADGVGGLSGGEIASRLAVDVALHTFRDTPSSLQEEQLLRRVFQQANNAVYDAGNSPQHTGRMATTLSVSVYRRNEMTVGHVGDSRIYLVRDGRVRCMTGDHTCVGLQARMNVVTGRDAAQSDLRAMLTRSVGSKPMVQVDCCRAVMHAGDIIVQCSDGLHGCVKESEIGELATRLVPAAACARLIELAATRGSGDNISVQVVRVEQVSEAGQQAV